LDDVVVVGSSWRIPSRGRVSQDFHQVSALMRVESSALGVDSAPRATNRAVGDPVGKGAPPENVTYNRRAVARFRGLSRAVFKDTSRREVFSTVRPPKRQGRPLVASLFATNRGNPCYSLIMRICNRSGRPVSCYRRLLFHNPGGCGCKQPQPPGNDAGRIKMFLVGSLFRVHSVGIFNASLAGGELRSSGTPLVFCWSMAETNAKI